jgi:hypothetical protein
MKKKEKPLNIKMDKKQKVLIVEDFLVNKMALTNIFFYETEAKINAWLQVKGKPEATPICFTIKDKHEVAELVLYADDLEYTLKINEPLNKFDIATEFGILHNEKRSFRDRIIMGQKGDIISFMIMPLIFTDICLDWELRNVENEAIVTLINFDKRS